MVAGLAAGLSALGSVAGIVGSFVQYSASQNAEEQRKTQMELEARRQRREQARKAQVARARATASATNQGAGQSSALLGGLAQIQNEASRNIVAVNQDEEIGKKIFQANSQFAMGGLISSLGQGISNLGGAFGNSAQTLTRLGIG